MTVPADVIDPQTMTVDEGATRPLIELSVSFGLREDQVGDPELSSASTLVTRAANFLAQAEDVLVFQGATGTSAPIFKSVTCLGEVGRGLLALDDAVIEVNVPPADSGGVGEAIFRAVVDGCAALQSQGHSGPFALALSSGVYAEAFSPLPGSLVLPADRITPLVTQGFVGSGALPAGTGVLLSVGGDTLDIAVGSDPVTAFTQMDPVGLFRFRVFERFALRIKDQSAILALRFTGS
jgi:uncharacterized linocin/CFP29 family protein